MTDLVDTTEMYLRTILDLEEEQIVPLRARISERLGHSGPTVSQTIARMERDGLVVVEGDRHLVLTTAGRGRAVQVMRKHRLAERLLADVIGLDWALVHDEACRWEHVMSEQVERRLLEVLGHPTESPYGNPIPGLAELGGVTAPAFMEGVVNIVRQCATGPATGVIRRLGEPVQFDPDLLARRVGNAATLLRRLARGEDVRDVEADRDAKSYGEESTFAGDVRDEAIQSFSNTLVRQDPVQAMIWAGSIANDDIRVNSIVNTYSNWRRSDLEAARQWAATTKLAPEVQKRIAAMDAPKK
jgi:DtxR family Mn-dependent transcriptional regulator